MISINIKPPIIFPRKLSHIEKVHAWTVKQTEVLSDPAPRKFLSGGWGSGKTDVAIEQFIRWHRDSSHDGIIAGSDTTIIRDRFNEYLREFRPDLSLIQDKASKFKLFGRFVYVRGGDSVRQRKRVRGPNIGTILLDEVTNMREDVIIELGGRLRKGNPRMIASTNPESPAHWCYAYKDTFDAHYTFSTWDNPHLEPTTSEYIARQPWKEGTPLYMRMILGLWVEAGSMLAMRNFESISILPQYAFLDPAYDGVDRSALCLMAWHNKRPQALIYSWTGNVLSHIPEIARILSSFGIRSLYFESNDNKGLLALPLSESGISGIPYLQTKKKTQRIVENVSIFLDSLIIECTPDVRDRMLSFSPDKEKQIDDEIDALATCLDLYLHR